MADTVSVTRPLPDFLTHDEARDLLTEAERVWAALQANNIGGFFWHNSPFYIEWTFRQVIEKFGRRDTGLRWTKDQIDAARRASTQPAPAFPREDVRAKALEEAAKIAEAHRASRIAAKQNALDRKQKSEARDHESMAIEAMHIAASIRTLLQGKQP